MKRFQRVLIAVISALLIGLIAPSGHAEAVTFKAWPTQKSGSRGAQVTTVQYLLAAHGHKTGVDGAYGPNTRSKVISFQKSKGLSADGIVGPKTWTKLTSKVLRSGSKGAAVKALQTQLRRYGHGISVDGAFGPATLKAVKSFQKSKGLSVDGVAGPNTWRALIAGTGKGGGGGGGSTTRAGLAKAILNDRGITLLHFCGPSYASPRRNIADTAAGRVAYTGGGHVGKRGVRLDTRMLTFMRDFGRNNSYRVTTILGCRHSARSDHYRGTAVDIDFVNGQKINLTSSGRRAADVVKRYCRSKGAYSVLGPGNKGHSGHVHCSWR